ncbi:hypothetical protein ZWY2020_056420 [Hordeum vulgare]|nr:hypothetical protein ZWY2020_056420 [Hordeum vulgare]
MSKFATPPPARNLDMFPVLDDATSAAHDAYDDAILDTALPLGALDAQIARVAARCDDTYETADTIEVEPAILPVRTSSPRYELPDMPEGYVMEGEIAEDFLACHPKRIEQDSQGVSTDAPSHPRKKKKDDRNLHASNPVAVTPESPNDVSVSDAETQSGDEHDPNDNIDSDVHEDAQLSNDMDVEIEPIDLDNPQPKSKRYDKNKFIARKHGKEREPWVQKPMPFPPKPSKKKDDEDFERFVEMIRPIFLQMCLTDMLKMSPIHHRRVINTGRVDGMNSARYNSDCNGEVRWDEDGDGAGDGDDGDDDLDDARDDDDDDEDDLPFQEEFSPTECAR